MMGEGCDGRRDVMGRRAEGGLRSAKQCHGTASEEMPAEGCPLIATPG